MADGHLQGSLDAPLMAARAPNRALMLAVMQQHGIALPAFDLITDRSSEAVPVEELWAGLHDAGGAAVVSV